MHIHRFDFELRPGLFHPQWREATYSTGESMVRIANNFSITCLYPLVANISCTNNIILYSTTHITIIISGSPRTPSPYPTDINTTHRHPKSNPYYTTFKHIPHPTPIYECSCVALSNVYWPNMLDALLGINVLILGNKMVLPKWRRVSWPIRWNENWMICCIRMREMERFVLFESRFLFHGE